MIMDGMRRITMSVTQQNSDFASDTTEFADKAKNKHRDKLACAEGKQDGCKTNQHMGISACETSKLR